MKSKSFAYLMLLAIFCIPTLYGCDTNTNNSSEWTTLSISTIWNDELWNTVKSIATQLNTENIKKSELERYNLAQYDYSKNNYEKEYILPWYSISITWQKETPNTFKLFDGWNVFYAWDEIWVSVAEYTNDNIICNYFQFLEQTIPNELMAMEYDIESEEEIAEFNKKRDDFFAKATYSVEITCSYLPEWVIRFQTFNYKAEWMEPFRYASLQWEYVHIFESEEMSEYFTSYLSSNKKNINFSGYNIAWKIEKSDCVDDWKWDTHEYKIAFDVTPSKLNSEGIEIKEESKHYEWCADKFNPEFSAWEEWMMSSFMNKSKYQYSRNYDLNNVSYSIAEIIDKYMLVNVYEYDWTYDAYQIIMEDTENWWKVLFEWDWNEITDDKCEELNQHDHNLMDMFFLITCPRG